MLHEDALREAAHLAAEAVFQTVAGYADGTYTHEPTMTGALAGALRTKLSGRIEGLTWSAHVMESGRGSAAEESATGADLLVHVRLDTPDLKYSKGLLIQSKRIEPKEAMTAEGHDDLLRQCRKMLDITRAAYVFDYTRRTIRCGSAQVIVDSNNRHLYAQCPRTPFRFFFEIFRSMIGDSIITSAKFDALPVPNKISLTVTGDRDADFFRI